MLLHDIERRFLPMPRCGTREQRADRANRLTVAPDDAADIGLTHLQTKDRQAAVRDFREHDFIGKLDELPNDELEKLSHIFDLSDRLRSVQLHPGRRCVRER